MKVGVLKYVALANLILGLCAFIYALGSYFGCFSVLQQRFYGWLLASGTPSQHGELLRSELVLEPDRLDFYAYARKPQEAKLYAVDVSNDKNGVFQSYPLSAIDYAVVVHQLAGFGVQRLSIIDPLFSQSEADPIELDALNFELQSLWRLNLGCALQTGYNLQARSLPQNLAAAVLDEACIEIAPSGAPKANQLAAVSAPQLDSFPSFPNRLLPEAILLPDSEPQHYLLPLVYNYNGKWLMSQTLHSLLMLLDVDAKKIRVRAGDCIWIDRGRYLPIDARGCLQVPLQDVSACILDAGELINPAGNNAVSRQQLLLGQSDAVLLGYSKHPLDGENAAANSEQQPQGGALGAALAGLRACLDTPVLVYGRSLSAMPQWLQWFVLLDFCVLLSLLVKLPKVWRMAGWAVLGVCMLGLLAGFCLWKGVWMDVGYVPCLLLAALPVLLLVPYRAQPVLQVDDNSQQQQLFENTRSIERPFDQ